MGFFDIIIYSGIAIMYNFFAYTLASLLYKNLQYNEKIHNTIVLLLILGILAIILSYFIPSKYINIGLYFGGILLILTTVIINYKNISDEIKLFLICLILGYLIWFAYKKEIDK